MRYLQPLLKMYERPEWWMNIPSHQHMKKAGIIFTSRHAVNFWCMREKTRTNPVFCVGAATAQACFEQGFRNLNTGNGDARSLAELIFMHPAMPYIFPSGRDVTLDFEEILGHATCMRISVYETIPTPSLRPSIARAFEKKRIHLIPLFSKNSALLMHALTPHYQGEIWALSEKIAEVFPNNPCRIFHSTETMVAQF